MPDELKKEGFTLGCVEGIQYWKKHINNFSKEILIFYDEFSSKIIRIFKKENGVLEEIKEFSE